MFSLMPHRRDRREGRPLVPREHTPFDLLRREFASLFDRAFPDWPLPYEAFWAEAEPWRLAMEEKDREFVVRAEVPGFEASSIVDIAPQVGIRETRRIQGLYALTGEDILSSARFADSIGVNAWPMELHADGRVDWGFPRDADNAINQLPWRMLVPQGGASNLLVAGRCASMTHEGQSAARASGGCFVMGQAAGTAAATLGAGRFADVDVGRLQRALVKDGVWLG